ncbi:MAG: zinc-ribbon domain containing protein [Vulcanimicrobiota bacterium]
MVFTDKTLECVDCGKDFVFTSGEQEFYQEKGFQNEPRRCTECRKNRKRSRNGGSRARKMTTVVCSECGEETQVPFVPKEGRPVYCRDCYSAQV